MQYGGYCIEVRGNNQIMRLLGTLAIVWGATSLFSSPVLASDQSSPARPAGNPGAWISTADYPPEALMAHVEGTTALKLSIDTNGTLSDCVVEASSGSAVLDATSCRILKERGRFVPATDGNKKPVSSVYSTRIAWKIPALPIVPLPKERMTARVAFDYDAAGQLQNCRVIEWHSLGDSSTLCQHMPQSQPMVFSGEDGKPTPYTRISTQIMEFEARPPTKPAPDSTSAPSRQSRQQ
jgi:TonB family protein